MYLIFAALILAYLVIGGQGLPAGWEVFAALLALVSPILLKLAPAGLKGKPMLLIAIAFSWALGALAMYLQGDFAHFDLVKIGTYLISLTGLQQIFYSLFKDNWNLSDPGPALTPGQPAALAPSSWPPSPSPSPPR